MKTQLRSSQPNSPRRPLPLEPDTRPSVRPSPPSQGPLSFRRICQDPLRCENGPGLHSHLVQTPRSPQKSAAAAPKAVKAGPQEKMSQKRTCPEQTETGTSRDKRARAGSEPQQFPGRSPEQKASGPFVAKIEEGFRDLLDKLVRWEISTTQDVQDIKDELGKVTATPSAPVPALVPTPTLVPALVPAPSAKADKKGSSELDAMSNGIRPGADGAERGREILALGSFPTRPDYRRHGDPNLRLDPVPARAMESTATATIGTASGMRHDEHSKATVDLVRRRELDAEKPGATATDKAATLALLAPGGDERRPWMQRSDARDLEEAKADEVMKIRVAKIREAKRVQRARAIEQAKKTEEEAKKVEEARKAEEAREEAESLAFDVVDRRDGRDPGDEYVLDEVEGCSGKAGEGDAGMCNISHKEVPGIMDGEYVLL